MGSKQTLWVVGGSEEAVPGIQMAKEELGLKIILSDRDEECVGRQYLSDEDHFVQASTRDPDANLAAARQSNLWAHGVISYSADVPVTVATLATEFGCRNIGMPLATIFSDKLLMQEYLKVLKLPAVRTEPLNQRSQLSDFRENFNIFVIKPRNQCGSRGVLRVTLARDLDWIWERCWTETENILQPWIPGLQISTETIISGDEMHTVGFSLRNYEYLDKYDPYVIENGGDQPYNIDAKRRREIEEALHKAIWRCGFRNCTVKGDIVATCCRYSQADVSIIELAPRLSGGGFSSIQIPQSTGVPILKIATLLALGQSVGPDICTPTKKKYCSNRFLFPSDAVRCHADRGRMVWATAGNPKSAITGVEYLLRNRGRNYAKKY